MKIKILVCSKKTELNMSAAPALQELLNGQQINYHKLHLKQFTM